MILEAALLIEADWTDLVDEVWVTVAPERAVVERLRERNNLSEEEALRRIHSQLSNEERAKHGHIVIDTDCTLDEVKQKTQELWNSRVRERV